MKYLKQFETCSISIRDIKISSKQLPKIESFKKFESFDVADEQIIESRLDNKNLQLWKSNDARPIISEIYTIIDEVYLGPQNSDPIDFLVSVDQFIQYAIQYDGYFAGNVFQNIGELKHMLEFDTDGISPTVYIAPFWFTRTKADLVNFWDVYSDTIYIKLLYDLSDEEVDKIKEKLKADECYMMEGKSGNLYLRVWWD